MSEIEEIIENGRFTGRAKEQTEEYLTEVRQILDNNKEFLEDKVDTTINV